MADANGKVKGSTFTADVGGAGTWFNGNDEEEQSNNILRKHMGSYATESDSWFKTGTELKVNY
jgi:hypothetical protein